MQFGRSERLKMTEWKETGCFSVVDRKDRRAFRDLDFLESRKMSLAIPVGTEIEWYCI